MSRKSAARNPEPSGASLGKEWQGWYTNHGPTLRFCLKFGGAMAVFYGLSYVPLWNKPIYPAYLHGNVWLSSQISQSVKIGETSSAMRGSWQEMVCFAGAPISH